MSPRYWIVRAIEPKIGHGRGAMTALLVAALRADLVQNARVCKSLDALPWAGHRIVAEELEVIAAAGSKFVYLPAALPDDGACEIPPRCAFVGLPCEMHAAVSADVRVSLFCGLNVERAGLLRALRYLKLREADVERVEFRTMRGLSFVLRDGSIHSLKKRLWLNYFYCPDQCVTCADYLGHGADISVGDREAGHNSVITWSAAGERLLSNAVALRAVEAREVDMDTLLDVVMSPYVQKEILGGYRRHLPVRARKAFRLLPVCVLTTIGARLYARTVADSRSFKKSKACAGGN